MSRIRFHEEDTQTRCRCVGQDGKPDPLLIDETAIFMGVNCLKCGRSAEHLLSREERIQVREQMRQRRREEVILP